MDITTLAAARAYTDKKVAEGGGGGDATVQTIMLTNYRFEDDKLDCSFNDLLIQLFAGGGGSRSSTNVSNFWDDLSFDGRKILLVDCAEIGGVAEGLLLTCEVQGMTVIDKAVIGIYSSFVVTLNGITARVNVMIDRMGGGCVKFTVVNDILTIPE